MLGARKLAELAPVGRDRLPPLPLVDPLEVRKPAAGGEMRRPVAGGGRGAPGERNETVDPELGGQPDAVAEIPVVPQGDLSVGVQRISPRVQRCELESARAQLLEPLDASAAAEQQ